MEENVVVNLKASRKIGLRLRVVAFQQPDGPNGAKVRLETEFWLRKDLVREVIKGDGVHTAVITESKTLEILTPFEDIVRQLESGNA